MGFETYPHFRKTCKPLILNCFSCKYVQYDVVACNWTLTQRQGLNNSQITKLWEIIVHRVYINLEFLFSFVRFICTFFQLHTRGSELSCYLCLDYWTLCFLVMVHYCFNNLKVGHKYLYMWSTHIAFSKVYFICDFCKGLHFIILGIYIYIYYI